MQRALILPHTDGAGGIGQARPFAIVHHGIEMVALSWELAISDSERSLAR